MSNLFGTIYHVCDVCRRGADEQHLVGWLIGRARSPERAVYGEKVIRCPAHISDHALRSVVGGGGAIRRR